MSKNNYKELEGDQKRKAAPLFKGCAYQVWQSVFAWLNLGQDEVLFLEGAEDFDIIANGKATTVQVKETRQSGTVTLNSKDITEAISNFWLHQNNNPNVSIKYRFLTTSKRGKEEGNPFKGKKGLDCWDLCKQPENDLKALRTFLSAKKILSSDLLKFIKNSNDFELRDRLVNRIDWDTANEPSQFIVDLINNKLIYYGNRFLTQPSESKKVSDHLFRHVFDVVSKKDNRGLRYSDFMVLFEEKTSKSISNQELLQLRRSSNYFSVAKDILLSSGIEDSNIENINILPDYDTAAQEPPPLPYKAVLREQLSANLLKRLKENGMLVLKGSTGMGKSTLANLIIKQSCQNWKWIDMRGLNPDQVIKYLSQASLFISNKLVGPKYVIDNLNFRGEYENYKNALIGFFYSIVSHSGQLIIITQTDFPISIISYFPISKDVVLNIPPLNDDEILKLASNYGCPKGIHLAIWPKIIFAKTGGHPQLVHASILNLKSKKWPVPNTKDFTDTTDIENIRREARDRLVAEFPSEDVREFAYRLSIFNGPFRRDHAIKMGSTSRPGELFDFLVGPWVERLNNDYFRISPLLRNAAKEIFSPEYITKLHGTVAHALLACKKITPNECNAILFHGITGETNMPLFAIAMSIMEVSDKYWPEIAQKLMWFSWRAIEPGQKLYIKNTDLSLFLRIIQFSIAVEVKSNDLALKVSSAWEKEIESVEEPEMKQMSRYLFLTKTTVFYNVPFSISVIFLRIAELIRLIDQMPKEFSPKLAKEYDGVEFIQTLMLFIIPKIKSIDNLDELISSLKEQSTAFQSKFLSTFNIHDFAASNLFGNVWLNESEMKNPDWERCIKTLIKAKEYGVSLNSKSLVAAAYNAITVIQDEYLSNSEAAIRTINEGIKLLGKNNPVLQNQRATILLHNGNYKEALQIWDTILPIWKTDDYIEPILAYRKAQISAVNSGDYSKAKDMAINGRKIAKKQNKVLFEIGYLADYAFLLYKTGNLNESIYTFLEAVDAFPLLPDPQKNIKSYALQKRVGHAILWIINDFNQRDNEEIAEPPPGCFSNIEISEEIKNYPIAPIEQFLLSLAEIECDAKIGDTIFKRLSKINRQQLPPELEAQLAILSIKNSFYTLRFETLISNYLKFFEASKTFQAHQKSGKGFFEQNNNSAKINLCENKSEIGNNLSYLILMALFLLLLKGQTIDAIVSFWKAELGRQKLDDKKLMSWLTCIEKLRNISISEMVVTMKNQNIVYELRLFASIIISINNGLDPADRFYGNSILLNFLYSYGLFLRKQIEGEFEKIVASTWLKVSNKQAYTLLSPRINVTMIQEACHDNSHGLKKVAKILLAARNAVTIKVADKIMNIFKELAQ